MSTNVRRLAIACGDPNGIGPEIALKALAARQEASGLALTLVGPENVWTTTAARLGLTHVLTRARVQATGDLPASAMRPGVVCAEAGAAAVAAATVALQACRAGEVDAVVAGPHHEMAIHRAGIAFNGYPSLVARVCNVPEDAVFLMLVGAGLRIVHATLHESVRHALGRLDSALVQAAARAGVRACAAMGVREPRVGIFGINPHASESGLFGPDDARVTLPAAAALREEGMAVDPPAGADVLLSQRQQDLYVAMFHDQGHIPVKLLAPQAASALSIGADALLSSVGHGCAMDIAGQGVARADGILRTIDLLGGLCNLPSTP
ncbi:4-hydroxythreonine-4-phosphate dehydrogenase PdxA [Achromobacter sp. GG226]|uniref:PdxA family dehydrogenase n=1 Tax=Verticiella alkaliphila TaxID=2779529 RepID=UPI001C0C9A93|nr:4-hydroxythreonine-4-phosphate dehydrogenase PdxA [Verticiella sp. GG226]MBU4612392.1 4-hydroxythreonine-4-phosphate dehydrogenase PdxA [Verticiella sp. GG226]